MQLFIRFVEYENMIQISEYSVYFESLKSLIDHDVKLICKKFQHESLNCDSFFNKIFRKS